MEVRETLKVGDNCLTVASGADWAAATPEIGDFRAEGSALDVNVKVFGRGEILQAQAVEHEEEVATILEGSFHIRADDEEYELTVGEGIIIPPSTTRIWRCTSDKGVLYRVLTQSQMPTEE